MKSEIGAEGIQQRHKMKMKGVNPGYQRSDNDSGSRKAQSEQMTHAKKHIFDTAIEAQAQAMR